MPLCEERPLSIVFVHDSEHPPFIHAEESPSDCFLKNVKALNPKCIISVEGDKDFEAKQASIEVADAIVFVKNQVAFKMLPIIIPMMKNLAWVHCWYTGIDGIADVIDNALLNRKTSGIACSGVAEGVKVTNGRGSSSPALAEFSFTGMLHFAKNVPRLQNNLKNKEWDMRPCDVLFSRKIALFGLGEIGKSIEKRARAFEMKITVVKRSIEGVKIGDYEKVVASDDEKGVTEVMAESDYIVCSMPGTSETHKYFNEDKIRLMKPSCVFVNVGRGTCVDEPALLTALKESKIRGAVLDVFYEEPIPADSEIWNLKNVLISAHVADLHPFKEQRFFEAFAKNYTKIAAGDAPESPVSFKHGY